MKPKRIYCGKEQYKNRDEIAKVFGKYFSIMGGNEMESFFKKMNSLPKYQQKIALYRKYKKTIDKLKPIYPIIINARNRLAVKDFHQKNYFELHKNKFGISDDDYNLFLSKYDQVIAEYNHFLPKINNTPRWYWSKYYFPCFLCHLNHIDTKIPEDIYTIIIKHYPILKKAIPKIKIVDGESSRMIYSEKTGVFNVELYQLGNKAHNIFDLVHEIGHVINYLECFKQKLDPLKQSKLQREITAQKVEFEILPQYFPEIWYAGRMRLLSAYQNTLFMILAYTTSPDQNLENLYIKTINRSFLQSHQHSNPFYLIDINGIAQPFRNLASVIANTKVFLNHNINTSS